MPKYDYVALDQKGNETKGSIEGASQNEAIGRVKDMQLFPTKITEADKESKSPAKKGAGRRDAAKAKPASTRRKAG